MYKTHTKLHQTFIGNMRGYGSKNCIYLSTEYDKTMKKK